MTVKYVNTHLSQIGSVIDNCMRLVLRSFYLIWVCNDLFDDCIRYLVTFDGCHGCCVSIDDDWAYLEE